MLRLLFLVFLLTACGSEDGPKVNPALQAGLDIYLSVAPAVDGDRLKSLTLQFCDTPTGRQGRCNWDDKDALGFTLATKNDICIRDTQPDSPVLRALVAHELAHCLHRINHSNDPKSLMFPDIPDDNAFWSEHLNESIAKIFE